MANSFKNAKADLTTTDATTLYTVPSATTTIVKSILLFQLAYSPILAVCVGLLGLYWTCPVIILSTIELLTAPLVVTESEIIKVTAATANRLHVVASLLEVS